MPFSWRNCERQIACNLLYKTKRNVINHWLTDANTRFCVPDFQSHQHLTIVVVIHEEVHFIAARLQKIHVSKFVIGFGPKLNEYETVGLTSREFVRLGNEILREFAAAGIQFFEVRGSSFGPHCDRSHRSRSLSIQRSSALPLRGRHQSQPCCREYAPSFGVGWRILRFIDPRSHRRGKEVAAKD